MSRRAYQTYQALVLAGLGLFLIARVIDGQILLYIHQRFVPLVLLGGVVFLALAQAMLRSRPPEQASPDPDGRPGWLIWLIALPLLIGLLIPQRALGTTALATRGMNTGAVLATNADGSGQITTIPENQRTILDWLQLYASSSNTQEFNGQAADVTGFVYHDPRLPENQVMVSRFTLTCCVADATALGMVVESADVSQLMDDTWVQIKGQIVTTDIEGRNLPMIQAQTYEVVPEPIQPYLFP